MADLEFLDRLNESQLQIADKIITKAQKMGVPPRLALSLAFVESGLNPEKVGDAGEIGLMQVKPATGKMFGYDEKALRNVDTNIDAGLSYLKQGIDRYKDPMLGVVAYNAGHDNNFLLGKDKNPPESTLRYVNKINAIGGFNEPTEQEAAQAAPSATTAPGGTNAPQQPDGRTGLAAGIGAAAGATLGEGKKLFGSKPPVTPPASPGTPVQNWTNAMGYGDRGAKTYSQAHQFEQGTRPGAQIRNPATGQTFKPQFNVAKPPVVEPPSKVMSALKGTSEFLSRSPVVSGALAGAGTFAGAQEAYDRFHKGDIPGAVIAGTGAAGSAVSAIPSPWTKAIGGGLAMASPAALYVLDKMRQQEAQRQGALPQAAP